jgi:hypothetical protein
VIIDEFRLNLALMEVLMRGEMRIVVLVACLLTTGCATRSSQAEVAYGDKISRIPESPKALIYSHSARHTVEAMFKQYTERDGVEFMFCAFGEEWDEVVIITRVHKPKQQMFPDMVTNIRWSECEGAVAWGHTHPSVVLRADTTAEYQAHIQNVRLRTENLSADDERNLREKQWKHVILVFARHEPDGEGRVVHKLFSR